MNTEERLDLNKNIDSNGCWNWTGWTMPGGYGRMNIGGKLRLVHRVSAALYLNFRINSKKLVLHKCDNRGCFNPDHLYIGTQLENMRDCSRRGRFKCRKGINNNRAKLTEDQVKEIRRRVDNGETQRKLAAEFGVPQPTISSIKIRKQWNHI